MSRSSSARERWRQIVERQQDSGLSVAEFCRRRGVAAPSLFAWKRRLGAEAPPEARPTFVAVRPEAEPTLTPGGVDPAAAIELHVGARRLILPRGFDPATLRQVLAVLEDRP
jgi:transposase-like protein